MKFKLLTAVLILFVTVTYAQKGIEDGSRYGHGEDSVRCIQNLNIFFDHVKIKNYPDAEAPFKALLKECPSCSQNLYYYGAEFLTWKIKQTKDTVKKNQILKELMGLFDMRITYFGQSKKYPEGRIWGDKARYLYNNQKKKTKETYQNIYDYSRKSIEMQGAKVRSKVVRLNMISSRALVQFNPDHKDQFVKDFLYASAFMKEYSEKVASNPKLKIWADKDVDLVNKLFTSSGAADCKTLIAVYEPKLDANKENKEFLSEMLTLLKKRKCTESEAYFKASGYMHLIEPTAASAAGLAGRSVIDQNFDKAIEYYKQAIELEQDTKEKAEYAFRIGLLYSEKKNFPNSRAYAKKALEFRPNFGGPYMLIARLYAMSARSLYPNDDVKQRAVYFAAVDKLMKAKRADPSSASEVNRMLGKYLDNLPSKEQIFMHNELKIGKPFKVGGWIQEQTIIRDK